MFSATFPSKIQQMASRYLRDYKFLTIGRLGGVSEDITQTIIYVKQQDKFRALMRLIQNIPQDDLVIIFCQRKKDIKNLTYQLEKKGCSAVEIHGDLSQRQRENSLNAFKSKKATILVATDVSFIINAFTITVI